MVENRVGGRDEGCAGDGLYAMRGNNEVQGHGAGAKCGNGGGATSMTQEIGGVAIAGAIVERRVESREGVCARGGLRAVGENGTVPRRGAGAGCGNSGCAILEAQEAMARRSELVLRSRSGRGTPKGAGAKRGDSRGGTSKPKGRWLYAYTTY